MMNFNYYYGSQADQFSFIRIPRVMLIDPIFADLSLSSKVLYGLLLDRMNMSMRNGWLDEENRVYIIYQISEIQEALGLTKKKAMDFLNELETFGLVVKKRRGRGLPSILYLKNFMVDGLSKNVRSAENGTSEELRGAENCTPEVPNSAPLEVPESTLLEVPESAPLMSQKDMNYKYINNKSIYPSIPDNSEKDGSMDGLSPASLTDLAKYEAYKEIIKENVGYDLFEYKNHKADEALESDSISLEIYEYEKERYNLPLADRVIEYMLSVICSESDNPVRINNEFYSREIVKNKLLRIDFNQFMHVIAELKLNDAIKNPKGYAISMMYNS